MDKQVLQMLGLFTVPREIKIKDKEERALENKLMNEAREFFGETTAKSEPSNDPSKDVNMFIDQKDAKK